MISILRTRIPNRGISTKLIENIGFVSHICALVHLHWHQDKLNKFNHHRCAATYDLLGIGRKQNHKLLTSNKCLKSNEDWRETWME